MGKLVKKIAKSFRRWFHKERAAFTYAGVRTVESMTDVPSELGWQVYVVSRNGVPRWVVLKCPCGCGERLNVNLMRSANPHWDLSMRRGRVSLSPSLWSQAKCESHFWLRNNGVYWCGKLNDDFVKGSRERVAG